MLSWASVVLVLVFICLSSSLHRKDELFNDVVQDMWDRNLKMDKSAVGDEGTYVTQV